MRTNTTTAIAVVIVVIVVASGVFLVIGTGIKPTTTTSISTANSASFSSSTSTSRSISSFSICTQIGVGNIFLIVKSSSTNKSIQGLPVYIKEMSGECPGQELNLGNFTTDSNGTVMATGQGTFHFTVRYNGSNFNTTGQLVPLGITCLTLYIPSGQVTNSTGPLTNENSCSALAISSETNQTSQTTKSSACCNDTSLNSRTPCEQILSPSYPSITRLRQLVEASPSFIIAENGSNYVTDGSIECTMHTSELQSVMLDYFFVTGTTFVTPCKNVQNFTYSLGVTIFMTPNGFNMSSMQIQATNSSMETFICTTSAAATNST